jgi:hypothetical protein
MGEPEKLTGLCWLPGQWVTKTGNHLLPAEWGWGWVRGNTGCFRSSEEGLLSRSSRRKLREGLVEEVLYQLSPEE